jgi:tetratricopeptide (TPR) repeat protein
MRTRVFRWAKTGAALLGIALLTFFGVRVHDTHRGLPLEPWHTYVPHELRAEKLDAADWTQYLAAEATIFGDVQREVSQNLQPGDRVPANRYFDGSPVYPAHFAQDFNRSFVLEPEGKPVGAVVLLHGLTDSQCCAHREGRPARCDAAELLTWNPRSLGNWFLVLALMLNAKKAKRKPTESLDAYALYLRGLARLYQFANRAANDEALRLFYSAIEFDRDFASAYGRAASCQADAKAQGWISGTPDEIAEVSRLARRAVELGKDDAVAVAAGGWALAYVVRDLDLGATLIDRALVLNSNLAEAWSFGGWVKLWLGEPEAAIERFAHAMRLSPLDPWVAGMRAGIAHAHFFLGRYDDAASWAAMALQYNPDHQPALRIGAASSPVLARGGETIEQERRLLPLAHLYGPAVRCKSNMTVWR